MAFAWTNFVDTGTGIDGYIVGAGSDKPEQGAFTTETRYRVQGLPAGRESTVYLWAVDGAGNLSEAFAFDFFVLESTGNWDGQSIPNAARGATEGQSAAPPGADDSQIQAAVVDATPLLRWPYEFNREYEKILTDAGLKITGRTPDSKFVEIVEIPEHPWFVAVQFHPEFKSRPLSPHPLFREFIGAVWKHKQASYPSCKDQDVQQTVLELPQRH